jgi:hypothetical protein
MSVRNEIHKGGCCACGKTRVAWFEATVVARPTVAGPVKSSQLGQIVGDGSQIA